MGEEFPRRTMKRVSFMFSSFHFFHHQPLNNEQQSDKRSIAGANDGAEGSRVLVKGKQPMFSGKDKSIKGNDLPPPAGGPCWGGKGSSPVGKKGLKLLLAVWGAILKSNMVQIWICLLFQF